MNDYDELEELMREDLDSYHDLLELSDDESDPDSAPRCPECLSLNVEVLAMHPRTGIHTAECCVCYEEFRY